MTDPQFYLAIGLPSFVALVGILVNVGYFVALNARMARVEDKTETIRSEFRTDFQNLTGKVVEIDNRLTRIEERLEHR